MLHGLSVCFTLNICNIVMSYSNESLIFHFVSFFVFVVVNVFALFAPLFNAVTKDKKGETFQWAPGYPPGGWGRNGGHAGNFEGTLRNTASQDGCRSSRRFEEFSTWTCSMGLFHQVKQTGIVNPTKSWLEERKHQFIGCLLMRRFISDVLLSFYNNPFSNVSC